MNRRQPFTTVGPVSNQVSQNMRRGVLIGPYVQRGTIAIGSGSASNTATITAIDVNNASMRGNGSSYNNSSSTNGTTGVGYNVLTNSTTITASRVSSEASVVTTAYEVTSFIPGVYRSVQRGNIALPSSVTTVATATITAVQDLTRSEVAHLGYTSNDGSGFFAINYATLEFTNTTTITATHGQVQTLHVGYEAREMF